MQFYASKNKQTNTGLHPAGLSDIISALRMAPASILLTSLYCGSAADLIRIRHC